MKINIEIDEEILKKLIADRIIEMTGMQIMMSDIKILVKSKQNYKSEWESASFKATYNGVLK